MDILEPSDTLDPGFGNISVILQFSGTFTSGSRFTFKFDSSNTFVASSIDKFLTSGTSTLTFKLSSFSSYVYFVSTPKYGRASLIISLIIGPAAVLPNKLPCVGSSTSANTTICGSSVGAIPTNEQTYLPCA